MRRLWHGNPQANSEDEKMNRLLLLAALIIVAPAMADDEKKVPVKRIDASSPAMQAVENAAVDVQDAGATRAQDYNSSRSNTTARSADYNSVRSNKTHTVDPDDDGDGVDTAVCGNGVDDDCDGPVDAERVAPANHNTTRSNKTSE